MSHPIFKTAIVFVALVGCGDGLVGPDYLGQPLFELKGTVMVGAPEASFEDNIDLALVWMGEGQDIKVAESFTTTKFPAIFEMSLYQVPVASALRDVPENDSAQYAVGQLIAFQDEDSDGRLEFGEPILGGAYEHVVVYFTEAGHGEISERPFDTGFTLKTMVGCAERDEVWMVEPQTSNVGLFVDSAPLEVETDLDCDAQPEDECLDAMIRVNETEPNTPDYNAALEDYYQGGCEAIFGCVDPESCDVEPQEVCAPPEEGPHCEPNFFE